uniref:Complex III assembly factor LYRM7 n=1 Tax=Anopheles culicifacies TaxID=139723 RepID=A0A182LUT1_9DIPT
MIAVSNRLQALRWYKILQRTKNEVFSGDFRTISAARQRIREEFIKNKDIKDEQQIKEKIQIAKDVDVELRSSVVQAVRKQPTVFERKQRKYPEIYNPVSENCIRTTMIEVIAATTYDRKVRFVFSVDADRGMVLHLLTLEISFMSKVIIPQA